LRRQSRKLSRLQTETVYTGIIQPILEYGSVLHHNCSASDSARLDLVQRKAALICTGAISRTETTKLMLELNWDSLSQRRLYAKLMLFYKTVLHLTPPYLGSKYIVRSVPERETRLNTRSSHGFPVPFCRLSCYQNSFFSQHYYVLEPVTCCVVQSVSISCFKVALKLH